MKFQLPGFLKGDSGTVESALVMIPTLILFLSVLQISVSALNRTVSGNLMQSKVARLALLNANEDQTGVILQRIPLPGGGQLIAGSTTKSMPILSPLLVGHNQMDLAGIAFDENS